MSYQECYYRRQKNITKVLGADKDKVHRDQTLGNNNKYVMFDCKSGFHQSEDNLNVDCHIYVRIS